VILPWVYRGFTVGLLWVYCGFTVGQSRNLYPLSIH